MIALHNAEPGKNGGQSSHCSWLDGLSYFGEGFSGKADSFCFALAESLALGVYAVCLADHIGKPLMKGGHSFRPML